MLAITLFSVGLGFSPQSYADDLVVEARRLELHEARLWQVLLHYRDTWSGVESEADDPDFFLADDGKFNPQAELEATIRGFFRPVVQSPDEHPQCVFPARYAWLKKRLGFDSERLVAQECPAFEGWLRNVDPGSATLVFAAAYLSSPASMYGHTFLRLNKKGAAPGSTLLSYIVNYAAVPTSMNPIIYTLAGLTGGFRGKFSIMPYYLKVQEYTNVDSRDLWEYAFDLSQGELDRLMRHLWELGSTYFDYYFLSENCSYHLLSLLEVARPSLRLQDAFSGEPTIPTDTIKFLLAQPGLVKGITPRASHVRTMLARRNHLSPEAAFSVEELVEADDISTDALAAYSPREQADILDSSFDYFKYRFGFESDAKRADSPELRRRQRTLLARRAELALHKTELDFPELIDPATGHGSTRFGLGGGVHLSGAAFASLELRPAFHDPLDAQDGFIPDSTLEMLRTELRWFPDSSDSVVSKIALERLQFVALSSVGKRSRWVKPISWRVRLAWERPFERPCTRLSCTALNLEGGPGLAFGGHWGVRQSVYAFSDISVGVGPAFSDDHRFMVKPTLGYLVEPISDLRVLLEGSYHYAFLGERIDRDGFLSMSVQMAYQLDRAWQIRVAGTRVGRDLQGQASMFAYF